MGSAKWGWIAVAFQMFVGYTIALSCYQLGILIAGGGFGFWTAVAILVDLYCLWAIFRPARKVAA
jgi:ferrous iron transport protein B